MSKHAIWLLGILVGAAACNADYLQIGQDQLGSHDGGETTAAGDAGPGTHPACGDGVVGAGEVCDDGNVVNGDGCSADCQSIERTWTCPLPGEPCMPSCGDGVVGGLETCDDGNRESGDGCSSTCMVEPGAVCPAPGRPCLLSVCGNGVVEAGELCDCGVDPTRVPAGCTGPNGQLSGDGTGCSSTCTQEPVCSGGTGACASVCGDGKRDGGEDCDDGNRLDGDGCSSTCTLEAGYTCSVVAWQQDGAIVQRSECVSRCGDGIVVAGEACDDGALNRDGVYGACSTQCLPGPYCGDGLVSGPEECDLGASNGKNFGAGGCTSACTKVHFCGDGLADGYMGEECDLGAENGKADSRCTSDCRLAS